MNNRKIKSIFELILIIGNYMNLDNRGCAKGNF